MKKQVRMGGLAAIIGTASVAAGAQATTTPALSVFAAGSLGAALTAVAQAFEQQQGTKVEMSYGASGLLKDRILAGEAPAVFASANMAHPQALAAAGKASAVTPFARNALCALASPGFKLDGKALALRLLDKDVRLGTSTPKADPSGDYAFLMFEKIESQGVAGPGSAAALKAKALQLTGGPNSPPPPGRSVYGELVAGGQADVFVTYCTNANLAHREHPMLQVLAVPDNINVSALYGVALLDATSAQAQAYTRFLLGARGQTILAGYGFSKP